MISDIDRKKLIDELRNHNPKAKELAPGIDNEFVCNLIEETQNEIINLRRELQYHKSDDIDCKFKFLALSPYTGNYYTNKNAFIMCAKDQAVPAALKAYIEKCIELGAGDNQIIASELLLSRVLSFQDNNITKIPDVTSKREIFACCSKNGG